MSPRDAFDGDDERVTVESDPEEVLSEFLDDEASPQAADKVEPALDE